VINLKRKVLLVPYFGKLPNYFQLFLNSCAYNNTFNFIIFTDQNINNYKINKNIKFEKMNFDELQQLTCEKLNTDILISSPYKLCDYRPMYGKIFSDYIIDYDFWGYCDIDMIFGQIDKFLPNSIFEQYDKIQINGHLCFYKNSSDMNSLYSKKSSKTMYYVDIMKIKEPCFFDEIQFEILVRENQIKEYINYQYADVLPNNFKFIIAENGVNRNYDEQIFFYDHGKILRQYRLNSKIIYDEFMYIHLQKRKMSMDIDLYNNKYYINTNNFSSTNRQDNLNPLKYKFSYYYNIIKKINMRKIFIKRKMNRLKKVLK